MALRDVYLEADFLDAAERTRTMSYLLLTQYDTTDTDTWGDVVTEAGNAVTALNVLTEDAIPEYRLAMVVPGSGTANVAANNQTTGFSRVFDVDGEKSSIEIPAWDDPVFDQNSQNFLSDAYDTAVAALELFLRSRETFAALSGGPAYSQSRTRKSRNIVND